MNTLQDAFAAMPDPPCGTDAPGASPRCSSFDQCAKQRLACEAFHAFVNEPANAGPKYREWRTMPRNPSGEWFSKVYMGAEATAEKLAPESVHEDAAPPLHPAPTPEPLPSAAPASASPAADASARLIAKFHEVVAGRMAEIAAAGPDAVRRNVARITRFEFKQIAALAAERVAAK